MKPKELDWSEKVIDILASVMDDYTGSSESNLPDAHREMTKVINALLTQQRTELETHFSKEKRELLEEIAELTGDGKFKVGQVYFYKEQLKKQVKNLLNKKDGTL